MANIFHIPGRNPRKGQILLLSTLSLSVVFATIGLTVDLGWGYFKKQQAQSAADSAAQAATIDALTRGFTCATNGVVCGTYTCANPNVSPATTNLQAGCLYAGTNGFTNAGNQTVTLTADVGTSSLPSGVSGTVPVYWVKATITDKTHNLFLYLSGFQNAAIAAEATAAVAVSPGGNCVLALSTNAPDALEVSGNVTVTSACGVYVNSNDPSTAIDVKGGATVSGTQVEEVGGYTLSNQATISPTPTTVGTIADPLSTLIPPSYSGCDYTNYSASGSGSTTLNPGVYCGGIKLSGHGSYTFTSGNYILDGGGFTASVSGTMTGANIMFFNTFDAQHAAGAISIASSPTMVMSAPASGTYEGILFYQDRTAPSGGWPAASITGSGTSVVSGTFYFPTGELDYAGTTAGSYQAVIASTIKIVGNTTFKNDPTGTYTGLVSRTASLIE